MSYTPGASKIFWISDKKILTNGHKKKLSYHLLEDVKTIY